MLKLTFVEKRRMLQHPLTNFQGCQIRVGQPYREFSKINQKLLRVPPNFEKNIALAFLKVA